MSDKDDAPPRLRWARLRFSIIGPLLAAPPPEGELKTNLEALAAKTWVHPIHGERVKFGFSTIERWLNTARSSNDPIQVLARKVHGLAGQHPSVKPALLDVLRRLRREHERWSYQLVYDNVLVLAQEDPSLQPVPSYTTIRRTMRRFGLVRKKKKKIRGKPGDECVFESREKLSFEVEFVNGLWHADFHLGSRRVLRPNGQYVDAFLLGVLDDRSRLCCHAQWYLDESAESFVHGTCQAILKRGLPREYLTDNGGAMTAAETEQGLGRLSILHPTTLPRHAEQNGKQECFWGLVEGRLIAMLEGKKDISLELLNQATQAWIELEYHRDIHSELKETPLQCFMREKNVARPAPSAEELRHRFRIEERRKLRSSDGTISIQGVRFELPSRYRSLLTPTIRYARWDLTSVDLVDPHNGSLLATLFPQDKRKNADGRRRVLEPIEATYQPQLQSDEIAPLLRKLMADYAATGLPPAYLPKDQQQGDTDE
jgi:transposase InsO family protein